MFKPINSVFAIKKQKKALGFVLIFFLDDTHDVRYDTLGLTTDL